MFIIPVISTHLVRIHQSMCLHRGIKTHGVRNHEGVYQHLLFECHLSRVPRLGRVHFKATPPPLPPPKILIINILHPKPPVWRACAPVLCLLLIPSNPFRPKKQKSKKPFLFCATHTHTRTSCSSRGTGLQDGHAPTHPSHPRCTYVIHPLSYQGKTFLLRGRVVEGRVCVGGFLGGFLGEEVVVRKAS